MSDLAEKALQYEQVLARIRILIEGESDEIAIMATVVCELHHGMPQFDWTGFYRVTAPDRLTVGPYQGGHGCLQIPFSNGICGRAARSGSTVIIEDVNREIDHIACASSTVSEIVVPVKNSVGKVIAVLDVDSESPAAFDKVDQKYLEQLAHDLA